MKPKLLLVWWYDASHSTGWTDFDKIKSEKSPLCLNTGFIVDEDKDRIILTQGYHDDSDATEGIGWMQIPTKMILKKKVIKY